MYLMEMADTKHYLQPLSINIIYFSIFPAFFTIQIYELSLCSKDQQS